MNASTELMSVDLVEEGEVVFWPGDRLFRKRDGRSHAAIGFSFYGRLAPEVRLTSADERTAFEREFAERLEPRGR